MFISQIWTWTSYIQYDLQVTQYNFKATRQKILHYIPKVVFTLAENIWDWWVFESIICWWKSLPLLWRQFVDIAPVITTQLWPRVGWVTAPGRGSQLQACGVKPWIWNVLCLLIQLFTCCPYQPISYIQYTPAVMPTLLPLEPILFSSPNWERDILADILTQYTTLSQCRAVE